MHMAPFTPAHGRAAAVIIGVRGAAMCVGLLLAPGIAANADACMCALTPPCAAVWQADAVFVGTVVETAPERIAGSLSWTVHKVAVNQVLRGAVDSFVTLVPGNRPSAEHIAASQSHPGELMMGFGCDYRFQPGRQYVIYARRTAEGRWATGRCTGTKPIDEAAADLDYIAGLPSADTTGRVYGRVERMVPDPNDRNRKTTVPAAGVDVSLVSHSASLTVTTDADGKLDVQVPPGEYRVAPVVPQTVRVYADPHPVSVPSRGCAPVYFSLTTNGRIEGRVVREDGTPVPRVSVATIPADLGPGDNIDSSAIAASGATDEKGRFSMDAILPGRYHLAVNAGFGASLHAPYATTYWPGAVRKQMARVIEIGEGERKTGFTIVVSPLIETTVSGVVMFEDDQPVVEASVTAAPADRKWSGIDATTTDRAGAFRLRVLTGMTYIIRVMARLPGGVRQTETVLVIDEAKDGLRLSIPR